MSWLRHIVERADVWFGRRRNRILLGTLLIAAFLVLGLVRMYPYVDDVSPETSKGNDWLNYKLNAIDILEEGIHIPRVEGAYFIPGGFLYNYFVALCFLILGPNSSYVYVLQFGFLALAAVLMSVLARRWMSPTLATVYMFVTAAFLLLTFRWWVIRLLSENVLIVMLPVMLMLLASAVEKRSLGRFAAAGLLAGLMVLMRSNLVGLPVLLAPLAFWMPDTWRRRIAAFVFFGVSAAAAVMLLPLRNLYVAGQLVTAGYGNLVPEQSVQELALVIGKRILFCAGIIIGGWDFQGSDLEINKSWVLVVATALIGLVYLLVRRRFRLIDAACVLTIVAAYGPFLVLPALGGYGFRFQHPYGPLLLFLFFRAAHEFLLRVESPAGIPVVATEH